jgi:uncharacterized protein YndB with AHSA1/START domain
MERVFDCTPDDLWDAWTNAEEFARWISPLPGHDAEVLAFDPRPGGRLAYVMACPAAEGLYEDGVFEVVNRPHELVIYQPHDRADHPLAGHPLTMRVRFQAEGDQTRMIFEHAGFPAHMSFDGSNAGVAAMLDKLAAVIAARTSFKETP